MASLINRINRPDVTRTLLDVWRESIERMGPGQIRKISPDLPQVKIAEPATKAAVKVVPRNLINRYQAIYQNLNNVRGASGAEQGLIDDLNRQRLSIAGRLAEQNIYV